MHRPLRLYVTMSLFLDIIYFIVLIARIPEVRKARAGLYVPDDSCTNTISILITMFYVCW